MQDIIEYQQLFFEEVKGYLEELEDNNSNHSNILHTIKGMASTMNYSYLANLCHELETELKNDYQDINNYYQQLNTLKNTVNLLEQGTKEEELSSSEKSQDSNSFIKLSNRQIQDVCFELDEIIQQQNYISNTQDNYYSSLLRLNTNKLKSLQEKLINSQLINLEDLLIEQKKFAQELAQELNKQINIQITGQNTYIPQSIYKEIKEILLHTIRNAIYHGIETPSTRQSLNKLPAGQLSISLQNSNNKLQITIQDDGKGLDTTLQDNEIIFTESFSTENNTNQIAGRGLGLHIVKKNIEAINGEYKLTTIPSELFKLEITIPAEIALTDCYIINTGIYNLAIPCNCISQAQSILLSEEEQINLINLNELINCPIEKAHKSFWEISLNNKKSILQINSISPIQKQTLLTQPYKLTENYHYQNNIIESISNQYKEQLTLILDIKELLNI